LGDPCGTPADGLWGVEWAQKAGPQPRHLAQARRYSSAKPPTSPASTLGSLVTQYSISSKSSSARTSRKTPPLRIASLLSIGATFPYYSFSVSGIISSPIRCNPTFSPSTSVFGISGQAIPLHNSDIDKKGICMVCFRRHRRSIAQPME
jgi:hypothetical protein